MRKTLATFVAGAVLWTLCLTGVASAQKIGTIDAGTTVTVRTNESIDTKESDGRIFTGVVEQDVTDRRGNIAIPKGSDVELMVKKISSTEVGLDLDSVMVNGRRFSVETEANTVTAEKKEGVGVNKRTGKYVGGGAAIGAIIGAITGGGKGAAIGAGAGAAAGAGAQILTRGSSVKVPAESLLTFRLAEPLRAGVVDGGYMSNGVHYHQAQPNSTRGDIAIGPNHNIRWHSPDQNSSVYVRVDNEPEKLFAAGQSGTQSAPWMADGHVYVFMLRDASGREIARQTQDLRRPAYSR